ncbi:MAG: mechanosensitive ion channel family protein [Phycisphaerales bacterium]|jgi:small-conductance mechanosensitive channel
MNLIQTPADPAPATPPADHLPAFLTREFLGNPAWMWIAALGGLLIAFLIVSALQPLMVMRLKRITDRTASTWDDLLVNVLADIRKWFWLAFGVYFFAQFLALPEPFPRRIWQVLVAAIAIQLILMSRFFIEHFTQRVLLSRKGPDGQPDQAIQSASGVIRVLSMGIIGSLVVIFALDNMGVQVTPLITGLGVGGIAVALAAQSVLADTFGSLTILFDKPFLVGDFIIVGDKMGTVEHIGIKTTRLRALSGEQLVFANSDLLGSRIQNYKRMQERRVVFTFGIIYETPLEKMKQVPQIVQGIVRAREKTRLDRVHFKSFGAYSLDFEVVYFVLSADYNMFMDIQQAINLDIMAEFAKQNIEFAYPTNVEIYKPHGVPEQKSMPAMG